MRKERAHTLFTTSTRRRQQRRLRVLAPCTTYIVCTRQAIKDNHSSTLPCDNATATHTHRATHSSLGGAGHTQRAKRGADHISQTKLHRHSQGCCRIRRPCKSRTAQPSGTPQCDTQSCGRCPRHGRLRALARHRRCDVTED